MIKGFFNEEGKLRKKSSEVIFVFSEEESFSILGEGGFLRFANKVFFGDKDRAFFAATTVLSSVHLKDLNWKRIQRLKDRRLFEEIESLDSSTGESNRRAGGLVESLVPSHLLERFFYDEKKILVSKPVLRRNKGYEFHSALLTEEQKGQYKIDHRKKVVREIDVLILSRETVIIVETKLSVTSKHVERLIETLKVREFLIPK